MLILETETHLPPEEVVARATEFFTGRLSSYTAYLLDASDSHARFHTEAGVVTVGVARRGDHFVVRGSSSRLHHALSQFLVTLSVPEEVRQNLIGPHPAPAVLPAGG